MNKVYPILSLFLFFVLSGCGVYTFNPSGGSSIKSIAVEPFENSTSQFGLGDRLTEIIIDAFIADGNIKIVPSDQADAILIGKLLTYNRQPETFDQNDRVERYKIVMDFELTLQKPDDGSEIWKQPTRQEGIYDANNETEEDGQQRAGERLVEVVLNKTTKSW